MEKDNLKEAAGKIEGILKEYDLNGYALLYRPGHIEFVNRVDASFSCARVGRKNQVEFGKADSPEVLASTLNYLAAMSKILMEHGGSFYDLANELNQIIHAHNQSKGKGLNS